MPVILELVTDHHNLIIDKASKIIDVLNHHLDEAPYCSHNLNEILEDIESSNNKDNSHWVRGPATRNSDSSNLQEVRD